MAGSQYIHGHLWKLKKMESLNKSSGLENGGDLFLALPACQAPQSFGFFDVELRVPWRRTQGHPWSRLEAVLDGELFRPLRDAAGDQPAQGPGGRPPPDRLKRFQPLGGQRFYNLSDEPTEYPVSDRLSFQQFIGGTKKNAEAPYGSKNHLKADAPSQLLEPYAVTDARGHDSQRWAS